MLRIGLRCSVVLSSVLCLAACGNDSGSGGTGAGSKKLTPAQIAAGACQNMGGGGSTCTGMEEYNQCVQTMCAAQYNTCLGASWMSGDFTGGQCATYMQCVSAAEDSCNNTCTIDMTCQNCFLGFGSCAQPCLGKLNCSAAAGSGAAGMGAAGSGAAGSKTCSDLEACCNTLSGEAMTTCVTNLASLKMVGDVACNAAYSTICAN